MNNLYEQKPEVWAKIESNGYACLAEVARRHFRCSDMDRSLGFANSTAAWHNRGRNPSHDAEMRARDFLSKDGAPEEKAKIDDDNMLLVVCSPDKADKVKRVLVMMGCEVEAV